MMTAANRNPSIEFIVKPKQDLYLEGTLRKLPRVREGEAYPCQMQKNQNFSCLFRHYAKHNGLRKEDLIFTFVDELQPDQTPETVHLMPHDEIWVEHRAVSAQEIEQDSVPNSIAAYSEQFRAIFESAEHADICFQVGSEMKAEIHAHKCILVARSDYFRAMFSGAMSECTDGVVKTDHDPLTFRRMLEFVYSNTVKDIESFPPHEIVSLLVLANEYLLDDLRALCEAHSTSIISMDNIAQLLLLSAGHNASVLKQACASFVSENKLQLAVDPGFRREIELNPELGVLLFEVSLPTPPPPFIDTCSSSDTDKARTVSLHGASSASNLGFPHTSKRRRLSNSENNSNSESELDMMVPNLGQPSGPMTFSALAAPPSTTEEPVEPPIAAPTSTVPENQHLQGGYRIPQVFDAVNEWRQDVDASAQLLDLGSTARFHSSSSQQQSPSTSAAPSNSVLAEPPFEVQHMPHAAPPHQVQSASPPPTSMNSVSAQSSSS